MAVKKAIKAKKATTSKTQALQLDKLLAAALKVKATSIHLERHSEQAKVRYRVMNELKSGEKISLDSFLALSQKLKALANVDPTANTPQEGRFRARSGEQELQLGTAFWPMYEGEKIIIKILDDKSAKLSTLLLTEEDFHKISSALQDKSGLILLTEMKLTEKNRLLYALLNELNREALDIFTLEDFIEYPLPGIHQQQLENFEDNKLSNTLAKLLRHEPDVVMISKITGPETAKQIVNAAAHNIVLTYLPGRNLEESMHFLKAWGIDDYILESVLKSIITQADNKFKII